QQVSDPDVTPSELVSKLRAQADKAITQLRFTTESSLTEPRELGRKKIPTTVLGLLFHAAEHSQRHIGQMLVTARILQGASVKR
ncbi:MAG: DinB family protein, partial [Bacteroidota bacterium]|nr:DinB family protein [Bacteroidota bacterium]